MRTRRGITGAKQPDSESPEDDERGVTKGESSVSVVFQNTKESNESVPIVCETKCYQKILAKL